MIALFVVRLQEADKGVIGDDECCICSVVSSQTGGAWKDVAKSTIVFCCIVWLASSKNASVENELLDNTNCSAIINW